MDLGAGGGTLLYNVSRVTKTELIGVDFSEVALLQLKMLVPKAKILKEDVTATSLNNESCDFCLSAMIIEHVDDNKFLKEIHRVLKPGGYLLITTILRSRNAWYFYKDKEGKSVLEPSHLREYASLNSFLKLLNRNGFAVLKAKTPRVKFPLIDPFLKCLFRFLRKDFWAKFPTAKPIEFVRKISRVPIPGYYAIEVISEKRL